MSVELARSAGFCFGVDRAVSTVYRLLEEGKPAATLGPIIHNPSAGGGPGGPRGAGGLLPGGDAPGSRAGHPLPRGAPEHRGPAGGARHPLCGRHLPLCEKNSRPGPPGRGGGEALPPLRRRRPPGGAGHRGALHRALFHLQKQRRIGRSAKKSPGMGPKTDSSGGPDHISHGRMANLFGNLEKSMYKRRCFCYNM